MGLIYKSLVLRGNRAGKEVKTLFDTGASHSFVRKDVAGTVSKLVETPETLSFQTASGPVSTGEVIFGEIMINGHPLFWTFFVLDDLPEELILGADFFQQWKIQLNPETEEISIDPSALRMILI